MIGTSRLTGLSIRNRRSRVYPQPRASIGPKVGELGRRDHCWEAIGPALHDFRELVPLILEQLKIYCKEIVLGWVTFSVYMIGRSEEEAAPTVLFFCKEEHHRKEAMRAVKASGILKRKPGFKTGNMPNPPDVDRLIQPAAEDDSLYTRPASLGPFPEVFSRSIDSLQCHAMRIGVRDASGLPCYSSAYTVFDGNRLMYLSVSHILPRILSSSGGNADFEIASDSDDEVNSDDEPGITSTGSVSSAEEEPASRTTEQTQTDERSEDTPETFGHHVEQPAPDFSANDDLASTTLAPTSQAHNVREFGAPVKISHDQDWALISLDHSAQEALVGDRAITYDSVVPIEVALVARDTSVFLRLLHDRVPGRLSETPFFTCLPNSTSFQEVYKIRINGNLKRGDCGAGAYDAMSGDLYGHVVATSQHTGIVFIMPAQHVFEELRKDVAFKSVFPCHVLQYLVRGDPAKKGEERFYANTRLLDETERKAIVQSAMGKVQSFREFVHREKEIAGQTEQLDEQARVQQATEKAMNWLQSLEDRPGKSDPSEDQNLLFLDEALREYRQDG
ncbi:hypothetical protein BDV96DRAFT_86459 [Lophiotrema nucula]|uniref:Uncharacterized protein n=1 Tax=Lophiotrema nucula TaxID=690887 RepID=A0A6A5Z737_9PLEO|nr:hypothetical protein BDV96DRAFT_86459 [Lophiotrema nucula]